MTAEQKAERNKARRGKRSSEIKARNNKIKGKRQTEWQRAKSANAKRMQDRCDYAYRLGKRKGDDKESFEAGFKAGYAKGYAKGEKDLFV